MGSSSKKLQSLVESEIRTNPQLITDQDLIKD